VDLGDLEPGGEMRGSGWSLDERRLFVAAREKERPWRIFVRQGESGAWRPVTPEGVAGPFVASPDGARVAARPPGGSVTLYPVDGGSPRELSGERGVPIHWSSDGRFLYLRDSARQAPAVIAQVDLATGKRRPWKSLMPADPAGITIIQPVLLSGDASAYAYAYSRNMNELYLAEGLG
jgi:sugar lactone lactonase YvrE